MWLSAVFQMRRRPLSSLAGTFAAAPARTHCPALPCFSRPSSVNRDLATTNPAASPPAAAGLHAASALCPMHMCTAQVVTGLALWLVLPPTLLSALLLCLIVAPLISHTRLSSSMIAGAIPWQPHLFLQCCPPRRACAFATNLSSPIPGRWRRTISCSYPILSYPSLFCPCLMPPGALAGSHPLEKLNLGRPFA